MVPWEWSCHPELPPDALPGPPGKVEDGHQSFPFTPKTGPSVQSRCCSANACPSVGRAKWPWQGEGCWQRKQDCGHRVRACSTPCTPQGCGRAPRTEAAHAAQPCAMTSADLTQCTSQRQCETAHTSIYSLERDC